MLYLTVGLAVALAIKTTGVLVTFALLVVPATTARLVVNRIGPMFALAIVFGILPVPVGLLLALNFNLPTGSTLAATSTGVLIVVALAQRLARLIRPWPALVASLAATALLALPAQSPAQGKTPHTIEGELEQLKRALRELQETVIAQQELILKQQKQIEALASFRERIPQAPQREPRAEPAALAVAAQPPQPPKQEAPPAPPPRLPPWVALLPELRLEGNFIHNQTFQSRRRLEAALGEEEAGEEFFARRNRLNLREIELGLRSAVDPFATFEGILSGRQLFGGEAEMELEEAFVTLLQLPFRLGAKIGKFRTGFGEFNEGDPEELPQVDPPNVITNIFGAEGDGWVDTGIRLELPFALGEIPLLLSAGVFNGDNEAAFHDGRAGIARKPAYFGRLEAFFEIGPAAGLELSAGYAQGRALDDLGRPTRRSRIFNAHLEFDYRHPVLALYRGFNLLTEFFYTWRDRLIEEAITSGETVGRYGLYTLAEVQLARNWFVAGRFDFSELPEREETGPARRRETAGSAMLSYKPSRFLTWRAQYKHTDRNFAPSSDELFLQMLFLAGFERPGGF
jgi:hypothetical protein